MPCAPTTTPRPRQPHVLQWDLRWGWWLVWLVVVAAGEVKGRGRRD